MDGGYTLEARIRFLLEGLGAIQQGESSVKQLASTTERAAEQASKAQIRFAAATQQFIQRQEQAQARETARTLKEQEEVQASYWLAVQKHADAAARNIKNTMASLRQNMSRVGQDLSLSVTLPLVAMGAEAVREATNLDRLKKGLDGITGSADATKKELDELEQIGKKPGIGFTEAIQGDIQLRAAGLSGDLTHRLIQQVGNATALSGKGKVEFGDELQVFATILGRGKVDERHIIELTQRLPKLGQAIRQAFGTSDAQAINKMGIDAQTFVSRVTDAMESLPRANASAQNSFDNFGDAMKRSFAKIGDSVLPVIQQFLDTVGPAIESLANGFQSLPTWMQRAIVSFLALAAAIGPCLVLFARVWEGIVAVREAMTVIKALKFAEMFASWGTTIAGIIPSIVAMGASLWASLAPVLPVIALVAAGLALVGAVAYSGFKANQRKEEAEQAAHQPPSSSTQRMGPGHYVVTIRGDDERAKQMVDDRIEQFSRGFGGAPVMGG